MAQRRSEYALMPRQTYVTPMWVYEKLWLANSRFKSSWDCCPIDDTFDFLTCTQKLNRPIATNPPYGREAERVVRHALTLADWVGMLLPVMWDCAPGRVDLFRDSSRFRAKYTILKRIRWENLEQKKAGPSMHHAWFVWGPRWNSRNTIMGWV